MTSPERQARNIHDAIRAVLLREWDPIGIRNVPEAQDEYDGYVAGVYRLLVSGATVSALAEHLARIERDAMGLSIQESVLGEVASRLKQIKITLEPT
jgi:hypothetical protein